MRKKKTAAKFGNTGKCWSVPIIGPLVADQSRNPSACNSSRRICANRNFSKFSIQIPCQFSIFRMRDEQLLDETASGAEMIIIEIIISIFLNLVQGKEIESENDYRFNRWNLTDSHWTGNLKKIWLAQSWALSFVYNIQFMIVIQKRMKDALTIMWSERNFAYRCGFWNAIRCTWRGFVDFYTILLENVSAMIREKTIK